MLLLWYAPFHTFLAAFDYIPVPPVQGSGSRNWIGCRWGFKAVDRGFRCRYHLFVQWRCRYFSLWLDIDSWSRIRGRTLAVLRGPVDSIDSKYHHSTLNLVRNQSMYYYCIPVAPSPCNSTPSQKTTPTCHANVVIMQDPKETHHTKIKMKRMRKLNS